MKKHLRWIIAIIVLAVMGVAYYYYLANKPADKDATESVADSNSELSYLVSRNIEDNYPESVRDVVKLYARITKAYYKTSLTDEQIEALGTNARKLFDNELKSKQTDKEFLDALKADIADYNSAKRYIADYTMDGSQTLPKLSPNNTTIDNKEYASLVVLYNVREGSKLHKSYTRFVLRKDSDGKWKILYWELVKGNNSTQE